MVSSSRPYDAVVVGLGAMGSAAAARLARRGARVLGLEQFQPAHDRGSSHGETRMIRKAYFEHPDYVPLLERAYALWRELERESGAELLTVTGGLLIGDPESATVSGGVASAERWGLPYRLLERRQLMEEFPTFAPPAGSVALLEPDAGFVRPEAAIRAQLGLAAAAGAELHFGEAVRAWETGGPAGEVEVETEVARYRAERLVVCPGAWAPALVASGALPLPVPLEVERQVLYWFEPADRVEAYRLGRHPVWIWETEDPEVQLYGFPALAVESAGAGVAGEAAKVAFFHGGERCGPDDVRRVVSGEEIDAVARALRRLQPAGAGRLVQATTCLYTNSGDRHFVIGELASSPQVLLACGFSGHGFKFAPVVGELLAALAGGAPASTVPALFSPARS